MKRQSRPKSRKSNKSSAKGCQQELADLQSLMKSIKDIQNRVNNYPIYLQLSRNACPVPVTPKSKHHSKLKHQSKSRNSCKTIQSKSYSCKSKTSHQLPQASIETLRKPEPSERYRSMMLNNQSKTFQINMGKHSSLGREYCSGRRGGPQLQKQQNYDYALKQPQIMSQYVSLQLENLKLEKRNLQLQKQLVEKSLMIERREKQLLKNKLKRMKTQQTHQLSHPQRIESAFNPQPAISYFDICPMAIQTADQPQQRTPQGNPPEAVRGVPKLSQIRYISEDADSLLLSEDTQNQPQVSSKKCQETTLERDFWKMMDGWQKRQKKQVRSALGDIANHMKVAYSK